MDRITPPPPVSFTCIHPRYYRKEPEMRLLPCAKCNGVAVVDYEPLPLPRWRVHCGLCGEANTTVGVSTEHSAHLSWNEQQAALFRASGSPSPPRSLEGLCIQFVMDFLALKLKEQEDAAKR